MAHNKKEEWINLMDTHQRDIFWAFKKYEYPKYMFADDYSRQKIKDQVLKTHRVKDAIEQYQKDLSVDSETAYKEAGCILDEISHAFSMKTIRFMALVIMKIVRQLFRKVLVNKSGIEKFRECAKLTPIVLVPTHNSYFDFLLASYICFAMDLPLPAIVSGQDFLHVAIVNRLLRNSGAFYMRRSFASDGFYRNIFTEYVQQVLASGDRPVEFFPEGTRSRCGKALQPKLGLLSMVLESFFHGYVQDVSCIPMSISYEKITEEQLYMFELLGIPKPKESLSGLVKARSILSTDFGTVSIHFGDTMSLREYCLGKIDGMDYVNIPRCERHLKIFGREAQEMKIAKYFGEKIVFNQQQNMVIFPRSVVATLVLQKGEVKLDDLVHIVDRIGKLLCELNCQVHGFQDMLTNEETMKKAIEYSNLVLSIDVNNVVRSSYSTLADANMKKSKLFKVLEKQPAMLSHTLGCMYLSSQRNRLLNGCLKPALLLQSIKVSNSMVECRRNFEFLSKIFKIEFIFDPEITTEQNFSVAVDECTRLKLVSCDQDFLQLCVADKEDARNYMGEEVNFITNLLQPFIDTYVVVMHVLLKNNFEYPSSMKVLTNEIQLRAADLLILTHINIYESLSLHTLTNAVTSLYKNGLINTIKNLKFENLVNSINEERLTTAKHTLAKFASPRLRLYTEQSRL